MCRIRDGYIGRSYKTHRIRFINGRLTHHGIIPPISVDEWQMTFDMYKKSPEFIVKNYNMDLEGFMRLEYLHRVLGRLIGIVFFVPMLYFMIKGYIQRYEIPKYLLMLVLGGMQGLLGWYMVQSGLVINPSVSIV